MMKANAISIRRNLRGGLLGSTVAVGTSRIFSILTAGIQLPILTRYLDPGEFALAAAIMAAASYASLATAESPTLAFRRFPRSIRDRTSFRYARRQLVALLIIAILPASLLSLIASDPATVLGVLGWGAGIGVTRFMSTVWLSWEAPWRYSLNLMIGSGARTAVLIGLVSSGTDIGGALALSGLAAATAAWLLGPRTAGAHRTSRPWPPFLGTSLMVSSAAITTMLNLDRILLPVLGHDEVAAAGYAAMYTLASLSLGSVLGMLTSILYPRAVRLWADNQEQSAIRLAETAALLSALISGAVVFALLLGGAGLIASFLGSAEYVRMDFLIPVSLATGLYGMAQNAAWVHHLQLRHNRLLKRTLFSACVGALLLVAAIIQWGAMGAVLATISAFALYALLTLSDSAVSQSLTIVAIFLTAMSFLAISQPTLVGIAGGTLLMIISVFLLIRSHHVKLRTPVARLFKVWRG
jgi:O-antigen/teichoic acid export membrane protein